MNSRLGAKEKKWVDALDPSIQVFDSREVVNHQPGKTLVAVCEDWSVQAIVHGALHRQVGHWIQLRSSRLERELKQVQHMVLEPEDYFRNPVREILNQSELKTWQRSFCSIAEKAEVLAGVESALRDWAVPANTLPIALSVADEFYTNAIFNAPGDVFRDRSAMEALPDGLSAKILVALDAEWIWIGVCDPCGTYSPARALSRMLISFLTGIGDAIQMHFGGAGIGSRLVLEKLTTLSVQVRSGRSTWVGGLFPVQSQKSSSQRRLKNIHITVSGGGKMGQFKAQEKRQGNQLTLELVGQIDEDAQFSNIPLSGVQDLSIDLNAVTAINSCGIREWIKWMKTLAPQAQVKISGCQKAIVDQFNMIDGFLPKGTAIDSFHVPYFCENCDAASTVLLKSGKDYAPGRVPQLSTQIACSNCGKSAEVDVIESQYLRFLSHS